MGKKKGKKKLVVKDKTFAATGESSEKTVEGLLHELGILKTVVKKKKKGKSETEIVAAISREVPKDILGQNISIEEVLEVLKSESTLVLGMQGAPEYSHEKLKHDLERFLYKVSGPISLNPLETNSAAIAIYNYLNQHLFFAIDLDSMTEIILNPKYDKNSVVNVRNIYGNLIPLKRRDGWHALDFLMMAMESQFWQHLNIKQEKNLQFIEILLAKSLLDNNIDDTKRAIALYYNKIYTKDSAKKRDQNFKNFISGSKSKINNVVLTADNSRDSDCLDEFLKLCEAFKIDVDLKTKSEITGLHTSLYALGKLYEKALVSKISGKSVEKDYGKLFKIVSRRVTGLVKVGAKFEKIKKDSNIIPILDEYIDLGKEIAHMDIESATEYLIKKAEGLDMQQEDLGKRVAIEYLPKCKPSSVITGTNPEIDVYNVLKIYSPDLFHFYLDNLYVNEDENDLSTKEGCINKITENIFYILSVFKHFCKEKDEVNELITNNFQDAFSKEIKMEGIHHFLSIHGNNGGYILTLLLAAQIEPIIKKLKEMDPESSELIQEKTDLIKNSLSMINGDAVTLITPLILRSNSCGISDPLSLKNEEEARILYGSLVKVMRHYLAHNVCDHFDRSQFGIAVSLCRKIENSNDNGKFFESVFEKYRNEIKAELKLYQQGMVHLKMLEQKIVDEGDKPDESNIKNESLFYSTLDNFLEIKLNDLMDEVLLEREEDRLNILMTKYYHDLSLFILSVMPEDVHSLISDSSNVVDDSNYRMNLSKSVGQLMLAIDSNINISAVAADQYERCKELEKEGGKNYDMARDELMDAMLLNWKSGVILARLTNHWSPCEDKKANEILTELFSEKRFNRFIHIRIAILNEIGLLKPIQIIDFFNRNIEEIEKCDYKMSYNDLDQDINPTMIEYILSHCSIEDIDAFRKMPRDYYNRKFLEIVDKANIIIGTKDELKLKAILKSGTEDDLRAYIQRNGDKSYEEIAKGFRDGDISLDLLKMDINGEIFKRISDEYDKIPMKAQDPSLTEVFKNLTGRILESFIERVIPQIDLSNHDRISKIFDEILSLDHLLDTESYKDIITKTNTFVSNINNFFEAPRVNLVINSIFRGVEKIAQKFDDVDLDKYRRDFILNYLTSSDFNINAGPVIFTINEFNIDPFLKGDDENENESIFEGLLNTNRNYRKLDQKSELLEFFLNHPKMREQELSNEQQAKIIQLITSQSDDRKLRLMEVATKDLGIKLSEPDFDSHDMCPAKAILMNHYNISRGRLDLVDLAMSNTQGYPFDEDKVRKFIKRKSIYKGPEIELLVNIAAGKKCSHKNKSGEVVFERDDCQQIKDQSNEAEIIGKFRDNLERGEGMKHAISRIEAGYENNLQEVSKLQERIREAKDRAEKVQQEQKIEKISSSTVRDVIKGAAKEIRDRKLAEKYSKKWLELTRPKHSDLKLEKLQESYEAQLREAEERHKKALEKMKKEYETELKKTIDESQKEKVKLNDRMRSMTTEMEELQTKLEQEKNRADKAEIEAENAKFDRDAARKAKEKMVTILRKKEGLDPEVKEFVPGQVTSPTTNPEPREGGVVGKIINSQNK